jgi:Rps23 Pro-64 3,4-dihydroxylase Tpa1-like proline 4-hydroxylase
LALDLKDSGEPRDISAARLTPPYHVVRNFLDEEMIVALLDHAASNQARFSPTRLESGAEDPSVRVSSILPDLGPFRKEFRRKVRPLVPSLIAQLRVSAFEIARIEIQLVAHGDGAFYKPHIDTRTGLESDLNSVRVLSGVYYFHAEPKAFSGGALRLYDFVLDTHAPRFVDIEPERNTFLVFSSWARHEVLPVTCPTRQFMDSRFAVNCWVHGKLADRRT